MKLIAAILSIYILILTGVPCCIYDNCENDQAPLTEQQHKKQTDNKNNSTTCSPFFCHTCSGFIVSGFIYPAPAQMSFIKKAYSIYNYPFQPTYVPFLWQPPDIA